VLAGVAPLSKEGRKLLRSLCDQAAVAVELAMLVSDLGDARLVSETEQLCAALLSSVSHDLRTPLAGIIGSVTHLLEYGERLGDENRRELLQTVLEESEHLNRHI
jgi:two-component system sensor histidine kinase KdpD